MDNAIRVQTVTENDDDSMATMMAELAEIKTVMTEMRDDQRAAQGTDGGLVYVRVAGITLT